jgi:hypothetical protein
MSARMIGGLALGLLAVLLGMVMSRAAPSLDLDATASESSHHLAATPALVLSKRTNGQDADSPPGPLIPAGEAVTWTYQVTNTGNITLTEVTVVDDQGVTVTCPQATLASGEAMTCNASGTAAAGQYANLGTARGTPPVGSQVTDSDPSHYFGTGPAIQITKLTNGHDADEEPGPAIAVGQPVLWTYWVTNTGDITLTEIIVLDDQEAEVACPETVLAPQEAMLCTASGFAVAGQYRNVGTASGLSPTGDKVIATDASHYRGGARIYLPLVIR